MASWGPIYRDRTLDFDLVPVDPSVIAAAAEFVAFAGGALKMRSASSLAETDFEREDGTRGGKCEEDDRDEES